MQAWPSPLCMPGPGPSSPISVMGAALSCCPQNPRAGGALHQGCLQEPCGGRTRPWPGAGNRSRWKKCEPGLGTGWVGASSAEREPGLAAPGPGPEPGSRALKPLQAPPRAEHGCRAGAWPALTGPQHPEPERGHALGSGGQLPTGAWQWTHVGCMPRGRGGGTGTGREWSSPRGFPPMRDRAWPKALRELVWGAELGSLLVMGSALLGAGTSCRIHGQLATGPRAPGAELGRERRTEPFSLSAPSRPIWGALDPACPP